jgi:hypothetical protein
MEWEHIEYEIEWSGEYREWERYTGWEKGVRVCAREMRPAFLAGFLLSCDPSLFAFGTLTVTVPSTKPLKKNFLLFSVVLLLPKVKSAEKEEEQEEDVEKEVERKERGGVL